MMTDDSTTKNTRLLDREFTPKTEHLELDLNFWFSKCDSHYWTLTTLLSLLLFLFCRPPTSRILSRPY